MSLRGRAIVASCTAMVVAVLLETYAPTSRASPSQGIDAACVKQCDDDRDRCVSKTCGANPSHNCVRQCNGFRKNCRIGCGVEDCYKPCNSEEQSCLHKCKVTDAACGQACEDTKLACIKKCNVEDGLD